MGQSFGTDDVVSAAIEKHADMVRRICFLYVRNQTDMEDIFQDVFLKFFRNFGAFESEEHQRAWLCRVAFNRCKDYCKSFWRRNVVSLEGFEIPCEIPAQNELIQAVLALPADQKEVVYLHYYEGRTIPEIAGIMKKNENTVYSILRRAKTRLKEKAGEIER